MIPKNMLDYAKEHPNCSLNEYMEYLKQMAKESALRQQAEEDRINDYLKNSVGKCFKIVFNSQSTLYFRLTNKDVNLRARSVNEDSYMIYISNDDYKLEFEAERVINLAWITKKDTVAQAFIISDEDFKKIEDTYKAMFSAIKEIQDMKAEAVEYEKLEL